MQTKQQLKHRIIHALCYELILFVLGTPLLSVFLKSSLSHAGVLWIMMSISAILWNMVFNYGFEKLELYLGWQVRTLRIRVLHAVGFEGGLLLFTVPIIAWMMNISLWQALLLDIGLALSIMVYTFIYQWCYDSIMHKYRQKHVQSP